MAEEPVARMSVSREYKEDAQLYENPDVAYKKMYLYLYKMIYHSPKNDFYKRTEEHIR